MPMKMGWRWYGEGNDPVTLADIKQIPGVTSIVWQCFGESYGSVKSYASFGVNNLIDA